MNHTSKQIMTIKTRRIIHFICVVSCPELVAIKTLPLPTGWSISESIIIDFSVLDAAVVVLVGETFSGVLLFAPR